MKKMICFLCFCVILGACSQATTEKKEEVVEKKDTKESSLSYQNAAEGSGNEKGFYYLSELKESGQYGYKNIHYFDFQSKQEIILCNKPECKHDNDQCASYILLNFMVNPMIFVNGQHLYLFKKYMSGDSVTMNLDGTVDRKLAQGTSTLEVMNLDGSNRKVLASWTEEELPNDFVFSDKNLYMVMKLTDKNMSEENSTTFYKNSYVEQIDLETGKKTKIANVKDTQLMGVYRNELLFTKFHYEKDPNTLLDDDNAYMANMNSATTELISINPQSKKETTYVKMDSSEFDSFVIAQDTLFYLPYNGSMLKAIHLDTKEQEDIMNLPEHTGGKHLANFNEKGFLQVNYIEDKELNAGYVKSFLINTETRETQPFTLYTNDLHQPIHILSETKDSYFVLYDYTAPEEYVDWADTYQANIQKEFHGLIKKSDYVNNNPMFTQVQSLS